MAEDTWAKVLDAIYRNAGNDDTSLEEHVDVSADSFDDAVGFLDRHGLISESTDGYRLTEKGFDVARDREMQLSQLETNMHLAVFTFVLTLAIVVQTIPSLLEFGSAGMYAGFGLLAFVFVLFGLVERRTGLFSMVLGGR